MFPALYYSFSFIKYFSYNYINFINEIIFQITTYVYIIFKNIFFSVYFIFNFFSFFQFFQFSIMEWNFFFYNNQFYQFVFFFNNSLRNIMKIILFNFFLNKDKKQIKIKRFFQISFSKNFEILKWQKKMVKMV